MPNINLIQEQRLAAKREEGKARGFFFGFAASAVVTAGTLGLLLFMTEAVSSEESSLKAKAQRIQPLVDEIDSLRQELGTVTPRLTTLEDARKMTERWSRVLDHLTTNTPTQTWLTSIRGQQPDPKSPVTITLAGMSTRQELIGEFMLRLQQQPDLGPVNLKFSQEKPAASGSQIEYQLEAPLKGTELEKEILKDEDSK